MCIYCDLPIYAKRLCRRHYKKMNAIKNGTYKKQYQKRKLDPAFIENNFPEGFQILCKNCNWLKELDKRIEEFSKRNL